MSTSTAEVKVSREDLNPCTVKLEIECSPEQVAAGFKKATKAFAKQLKVPGFRPGQAPTHMVEKMVSEDELKNSAVEHVVNAAYKQALKQEEIEPDNQPMFELKNFEREPASCEFTVTIPLPPIVELAEYKGLSAEKFKVEVSDDEIGRQIDELRSNAGQRSAVTDRGIGAGDNALVNIKVDGEEGDGRNFMVVAGQTFEDLDQALEGMKVDDIKSLELNFPDSFEEADLAGKSEKCTVTVRQVSAVEMPELTDEFAQSLNLKDVGDLKEKITENIKAAKENMAQNMVHERLLEQVAAASSVTVSDTTWEGVAERRLAEIEENVAKEKSTLLEYAEKNGMTEEEFKSRLRDEAKAQVERAVLIKEIFEKEGLQITNNDLNDQFLRIAYENRVPQDKLKEFAKEFGPQIQEEAVFRTMYTKVVQVLADSANIKEVDPPEAQGS